MCEGEGWLEVEAVDRGRIWDDTLVVDILEEMDKVRRLKGLPPGRSLSESNSSSCKGKGEG